MLIVQEVANMDEYLVLANKAADLGSEREFVEAQ
jgi:hypothetical protein